MRQINHPAEVGLGMIGGDENGAPAIPPVSGAPLAWGTVYRSAYLCHLAAVYFAFGFSYIIYSTFFVKHLVREMGLSTAPAMAADGFGTRLAPAALGVATIVFGLGQALGPYLAGASALVLGAGGALLLPSKAPQSRAPRDRADRMPDQERDEERDQE